MRRTREFWADTYIEICGELEDLANSMGTTSSELRRNANGYNEFVRESTYSLLSDLTVCLNELEKLRHHSPDSGIWIDIVTVIPENKKEITGNFNNNVLRFKRS